MSRQVLFVNHNTKNCGVYQFGLNTFSILKNSKNYEFHLAEVNSGSELDHVLSALPALNAIIYNYYPSTMSWLTNDMVLQRRQFAKQFVIKHETGTPEGFDGWIHIDPTFQEFANNYKTLRPIPLYNGGYITNKVLKFGSFGFGFGNKGFPEIVKLVNNSFDIAEINFLIPFAAFGDSDGRSARSIEEICRQIPLKSGVTLNVYHDFRDTDKLLEFLAMNDTNIFMYEYAYGRGISSVIDYALAVKRPIALTKSWQFRHLFGANIFLEDNDLKTILENGTTELEPYYEQYSHSNFIRSYERILDHVLQ